MVGDEEQLPDLEITPTWAVAAVVFVLIFISVLIERGMGRITKGKIALMSKQGVNELQILIFVLALFHVLSCVLTFGLGMAKVDCCPLCDQDSHSVESCPGDSIKHVVLHWGGRWEDPRRDIGYTHDLYVDGHKHIINNVDGDQFYFHGLLDFVFSTMSEMNAAFQPGVVLDVMTLYLEQRDEVPLRIVDPIDLNAIPEVLLIDSDGDAPIEEIATQVEPIVEPIVSNIQAQKPKKLVTKPRLKKKKTLLKLVDKEDVEQVQVEVQVPERVQDQEQVYKWKRKKESTTRSEPKAKKTRPSELLEEALDELPPLYFSDDEVIIENTDVGGNTVGEVVEDMGGNTVDGEHRGGIGDMGVNTDNWSELDPDNLNAEEGYYSTHTSQDGDDGPTQENIDRCDLEFRNLAKEYDNIFAEEEDTVHSVPPQPTYGELRVGMEWSGQLCMNAGHTLDNGQ
ncbi:hypothetical protein GIB67_015622 [Kingdonia uniflora]|uniref:MLO-like protein n=1 Tax=Kingdonia uniflora TaxID=39325 RepID=A0A7J7NUD3_9MAGN|nr:hypothetical protein GIB67_015622 [Kingdonia uniflora]